jgi:thymidylate synthase ThyX
VHSDVLTFNPNSARPEEEIYVNIPKVKADSVLVPDSMALVFDFKNSNTKSWFRNNLGKLLQRRLEIRLAGGKVYDNSGESLLEVYKDLWLHRKQRDNMVEDGIASEAMRKKYPKMMLQTMMWMPLHCSKYLERNR